MRVIVMSRWNRNGEGYADSTAYIAIQKVSREEREAAMGQKRSCRRTTDENIIHEKAVKMRKMTDEQLVHYIEDRIEKARSEGFKRGKEQKKAAPQLSAVNFVEEIRLTPEQLLQVDEMYADKCREIAELESGIKDCGVKMRRLTCGGTKEVALCGRRCGIYA